MGEAGDLYFLESHCDIKDELLIKCQSRHDGTSRVPS